MALKGTATGPSSAEAEPPLEGVSRAQWSAPNRRIGNLLVATQFSLIGLCLLPVGPTIGSGQLRPLGLACLVLAVAVGVLALVTMGSDTRVHPVPHAEAPLRSNGIYGWIRHPMYAAVLLACLGIALTGGRVLSLLALLGLMAVLRVKSGFEDRLLAERFGWQFAVYASRVPAVIPQPWRSHRR